MTHHEGRKGATYIVTDCDVAVNNDDVFLSPAHARKTRSNLEANSIVKLELRNGRAS